MYLSIWYVYCLLNAYLSIVLFFFARILVSYKLIEHLFQYNRNLRKTSFYLKEKAWFLYCFVHRYEGTQLIQNILRGVIFGLWCYLSKLYFIRLFSRYLQKRLVYSAKLGQLLLIFSLSYNGSGQENALQALDHPRSYQLLWTQYLQGCYPALQGHQSYQRSHAICSFSLCQLLARNLRETNCSTPPLLRRCHCSKCSTNDVPIKN